MALAFVAGLRRSVLPGVFGRVSGPAVSTPSAASLRPPPGPVALPARSFASFKHKKLIKMAKGYRNRAKNVYSVALQRVEKALQYAYRCVGSVGRHFWPACRAEPRVASACRTLSPSGVRAKSITSHTWHATGLNHASFKGHSASRICVPLHATPAVISRFVGDAVAFSLNVTTLW